MALGRPALSDFNKFINSELIPCIKFFLRDSIETVKSAKDKFKRLVRSFKYCFKVTL